MKMLNRGDVLLSVPAPNAGLLWTRQHEIDLILGFASEGHDVTTLAINLGRGRDSVIARLNSMRLLGEPWGSMYQSNYSVLPSDRLLKNANRELYQRGHASLNAVHLNSCFTNRSTSSACLIKTEVTYGTEVPTKEHDMSKPIIETKTFIAGVDASTLTDIEIFNKIAELEVKADKWSKVQNKPKKLGKMIDEVHADIAALVKYVDERPDQ